jgi:hypothetical protein
VVIDEDDDESVSASNPERNWVRATEYSRLFDASTMRTINGTVTDRVRFEPVNHSPGFALKRAPRPTIQIPCEAACATRPLRTVMFEPPARIPALPFAWEQLHELGEPGVMVTTLRPRIVKPARSTVTSLTSGMKIPTAVGEAITRSLVSR